MNIQEWKKLNKTKQQYYLHRSEGNFQAAYTAVQPIIDRVRNRGDAALREYTRRFDGAHISSITVGGDEFSEAEQILSSEMKEAIEYAIENVRNFHRKQMRGDVPADFGAAAGGTAEVPAEVPVELCTVRPGIRAGKRYTAIDSVGLYVPRGRGSFPSMLYMLAVPAVLASVPHISIATPPQPNGKVDPACLYAARVCGIELIYRIGGSQAIAALAFGTETVQKVLKVVGPGSIYVNAAKRLLADTIDTGLPAGPSEAVVVADAGADPHLVTLDLCTEAEHGSDSSAVLITDSPELAMEVKKKVEQYVNEIPLPRKTFITDVFQKYGGIFLVDTIEEALKLADTFAPEHLQIQTATPQKHLEQVKNAGEILLGPYTPFTMANYAAGANAVLPTGGKARTWSAVSVQDFIKSTSIVEIDAAGYADLEKHCRVLAEYEGFYAHHEAIARRIFTETT
ncbi:MAG: histidinol dehydrogenase [Salinispira sp.]